VGALVAGERLGQPPARLAEPAETVELVAAAQLDLDAVVDRLTGEGLATWKLPEELVVWDEPFPENAAGKVLRDRLADGGAGRPRWLAPRLRAVSG